MEDMKTKRIIHTATCLLAIFFPNSSCLVFNQEPTNNSVLDVDGNQLQPNTKYYIFPLPDGTTHSGGGGGLVLSMRDPRNPCPPNVKHDDNPTHHGLSLKIFPVDNKHVVNVSTDVNIAFMAATTCVQRTVWQLGRVDAITGRVYVRSDGELGRPGAETVRNWFKIDKSGKGYKIVYCPSVCSRCRLDCGEVGVFVENGRRWLGLGGQSFVIVFNKVNQRFDKKIID